MEPAEEILDAPPDAPARTSAGQLSAAELDAEFERFFIAHHESILRALVGATGDHEVAVDATQDAFIKAHTRWSLIRTYETPDAWIRRVAINVSRDRMRSERRRRNREATHDPTVQLSTTDQFEADANVRALLDQLPPRQREVARLFYVDDHRVDDIARQLGVSSGTVKSYLAEARDRLRHAHPS